MQTLSLTPGGHLPGNHLSRIVIVMIFFSSVRSLIGILMDIFLYDKLALTRKSIRAAKDDQVVIEKCDCKKWKCHLVPIWYFLIYFSQSIGKMALSQSNEGALIY
jgi:hypothetical protein